MHINRQKQLVFPNLPIDTHGTTLLTSLKFGGLSGLACIQFLTKSMILCNGSKNACYISTKLLKITYTAQLILSYLLDQNVSGIILKANT